MKKKITRHITKGKCFLIVGQKEYEIPKEVYSYISKLEIDLVNTKENVKMWRSKVDILRGNKVSIKDY